MSYRPLEEMGQEGLDHVDRPVEVDVDHPLDDLVVELIELHERLDDAGDVDQPIDRAVGGDHLTWERLGCVTVGDVHHESGQSITSTGQARRLVQAFLTDVDRGNSGLTTEKLEDYLLPDPIPSTGDHDDFVGNIHDLRLRMTDR